MTLIDSNILIDIWREDPKWGDWSSDRFAEQMGAGPIAINPIIYGEISLGFDSENELEKAVRDASVELLPLPYAAAFSAGRAFKEYRKRGGAKTTPLPDFWIGAHAEVENLTLLTRDSGRFRNYFPKVIRISPEEE